MEFSLLLLFKPGNVFGLEAYLVGSSIDMPKDSVIIHCLAMVPGLGFKLQVISSFLFKPG